MKNSILKISILSFIFILSFTFVQAQEEDKAEVKKEEVKKKDKPVRKIFEASTLIENATMISPSQGALELIIQHRFGGVNNGFSDLFGIYAASNIRMGLQYGITDDLMISIGTEKNNKLNDLTAKYNILTQTRKNTIPVSLTVVANISMSGLAEEFYGLDYKFMDRMSYFGQIIITRKFTDEFTFQLAPSYSHFNAVDETYQNNKIGLMAGGRYKLTKKFAVITEYHQPINVNPIRDTQLKIEPGVALGFEVATSTHAFQLFASTYEGILPQHNYIKNTNQINADGIAIGFNITVKF